jgi:predicted Zn-dependent protease
VAWSLSHDISHALARSSHEKNFYERTGAYTSSLNALEEQSWALEAAENAEELDELRFLALSRYHEYEADYIGMVIAAEAGCDPQHAIDSLKATQLGDAIYESDVEEEESHPSVRTTNSP